MQRSRSIQTKAKLVRFTTAIFLCGCLLFLTGINFLVYGNSNTVCMFEQADTGGPKDEAPEKPVEEKSSGVSNMQEEYVHEQHLLRGLTAADNTFKYFLMDEARLAIVHFELISPPPDL
ncbi:MAG: hypothetical protein KTQ13_00925 [Ferruginibacter sp.]|nr:hypothetical protein [Chitinophagaceae bacterium]MBP6287541.1 hypothetical protein [Ferruginibacter sp.]MBU9935185.1 hypothetical protein [Ferruginibacter sp.]